MIVFSLDHCVPQHIIKDNNINVDKHAFQIKLHIRIEWVMFNTNILLSQNTLRLIPLELFRQI